MYRDDELLPISALQHVMFCERQCALIHVEQQWKENTLTLEGARLHARSHEAESVYETRGDIVIARGLALRSYRLGLTGRSDVVELHRCADNDEHAVTLPGVPGKRRLIPIEYKRGKPKKDSCDKVQLCAQALCLEEMLGGDIEAGSLFYGTKKRRLVVPLTLELREITAQAATRLRAICSSPTMPTARLEPKCESCSLKDICMPSILSGARSVSRYVDQNLAAIENEIESQ